MADKSKILRRNITLMGDDIDTIDKLQKALKDKLGVKILSQANVIRYALDKLAKTELQ